MAERISQSPHPKIQKVANYLRDRKDFAKYYSPRLLSLGPIHHGEPHLQLGGQFKERWLQMYLERSNKSAQELLQNIAENINDLKVLYSEDAIRHFDDEQLKQILFVDGCSLLQILHKFDLMKPEDLKVKVGQMGLILQDVLLLENQLPFQLVKLLSDESDVNLMETIGNFLSHLLITPARELV